ncbi:hypothetical protein KXV85_004906, partial [Aspergillus fumigatus]
MVFFSIDSRIRRSASSRRDCFDKAHLRIRKAREPYRTSPQITIERHHASIRQTARSKPPHRGKVACTLPPQDNKSDREARLSASSFDITRRGIVLGGLGIAGTAALPRTVWAQGRSETLLVVQELGPNSLDMQGVGSNQTVNGL